MSRVVGLLSIGLGFTLVPMEYGWVLCKLWAWFIVPHFHTEPLPFITALGVWLTVTFLTATIPRSRETNTGVSTEELSRRGLAVLTYPLFILLLGKIILLIWG
jgi:hypothetical protein